MMWYLQDFTGTARLLLILVQLVSCFIDYVDAASDPPACREAVFETINIIKGEPLEENVISSHYVNSWLECGEKCLENDDCATFSHRTTSSYQINCKISNQLAEFVVNVDAHDVDMWTTHEIREAQPEICLTQQPCKNSGRCVRNACEPEGYMCICSKLYHGKNCETENNDFDVVFLSQDSALSYIQMDNINSDLDQFTFTAWFKFASGIKEYHLLSYKTDNKINLINVFFMADSQTSVTSFHGHIMQHSESSYMIPINDNVWHHLGFAWNSKDGRWDVLIDGTPRALRDSVETGKIIPGGGTLVIGQRYTSSGFVTGQGLLGQITGLNIWNTALSGDELEDMAKSRGNEQGNILRWFNVVGNSAGNVQVVMPSIAHNTNKDLNIELQFGSNSSEVGYTLSPGPDMPFDRSSVCLWLKSAVTSTFVSYDVQGETAPAFSFGITTTHNLFATINGTITKSTVKDDSIVNDYWHFVCVTWDGQNGEIKFFYEGLKQHPGSVINAPTTRLSQGGVFSVGVTKDQSSGSYVTSFVGTLSCLNIWSLIQSPNSITAMASGGMNINGAFLAWRDVSGHIVGNLIVLSNTLIYYPGYSLLARRSKWCNDHVTSLNCGTLYARLGEGRNGGKMAWRCYCADALHPSKYAYNFSSKRSTYVTKHEELLAIN